jgi:DnaJ-class molecular chaperone
MNMEREVKKEAKVALCRRCHGTGEIVRRQRGDALEPRDFTKLDKEDCPQCQGSGRVKVSCVMKLKIEPYQPLKEGK